MINQRLAIQRGLDEARMAEIGRLHAVREQIYSLMENTDDPCKLKSHAANCTEIEFQLQDLWGFTRNANYHRFWRMPKCTCPNMDNEDAYPIMQYHSTDCPIHGDGV